MVAVPTLKTDVSARVDGDLATVEVVQTFRLPADTAPGAVHAKYVFPLPADAAVFDMVMTSESGVVRADVARRSEARARYEAAADRGAHAALLEQDRPNVFVQRVANLTPGEEVRVALSYAHPVAREGDTYRFVLPTVVGPRALPEGAPHNALPEGQWTVQPTDTLAAPLPATVDPDRLSLQLQIDPGLSLAPGGPRSPTHALSNTQLPSGAWRVALARGRVVDNRDLVVTWRPEVPAPAVATSVSATDGRGVVQLLIAPPSAPAAADLTPRELVFVLDTSCSMRGFPLQTAKRLMHRALDDLRPTDRFRIVRFSSRASQMADSALPADPATLRRARAFVDRLAADGSTNVVRGVDRAPLPRPCPTAPSGSPCC